MRYSSKTFKQRRSVVVMLVGLLLLFFGAGLSEPTNTNVQPEEQVQSDVLAEQIEGAALASDVLEELAVKGRAPKTGYSRSQFGEGWANIDGCDTRNLILARDLEIIERAEDGCIVLSGVLLDPYSGMMINFQRGASTSSDVQIDHVVALSDAWQKGAQNISDEQRLLFANDPLNLLAVSGELNQQKGDADTASWLPPNRAYRCQYVARQIAVKAKYSLWVTEAEKASMKRILNGCGGQKVPIVS